MVNQKLPISYCVFMFTTKRVVWSLIEISDTITFMTQVNFSNIDVKFRVLIIGARDIKISVRQDNRTGLIEAGTGRTGHYPQL